ncbi:citrate synthase [Rudaeicoccus suwonensis]|uniref:citrate synthase (unknown stereospecificity) n=1 Tax=Rudaeicoccus suwonensis TaxID=657409 RepID=A0A561EBW0_9MICO|nr:citrate synthase [Rudaeicoccus suwonensis]TWE13094.1 citrate synthase [Rudaeicoccus suwonensis]
MPASDLVTTAQAADLLGVRVSTVYSYVSRGLLRRADEGRTRQQGSRFDRDEVVALAASHHRQRAGTFELSIETAITDLDPAGRLFFRGHDACELAERHSFEQVAELVWGTPGAPTPWPSLDIDPVLYDARGVPSPTSLRSADHIRRAILTAAENDSDREDISADHFRQAARRSVTAALASIPPRQRQSLCAPTTSVVDRLWPLLSERPCGVDEHRALQVALVLLIDHELATSTIAARAAASTGAGPYLVLLAGAGALGGPRHGAASAAAYDLIRDYSKGTLTIGVAPAGFGHAVYRDVDPRAEQILLAVGQFAPDVAELVDDLALQVRRVHGLAPNVDLALAALSISCGFRRDAGEAIFLLARIAGFTAHGIEEQGHRMRFRPRAAYRTD